MKFRFALLGLMLFALVALVSSVIAVPQTIKSDLPPASGSAQPDQRTLTNGITTRVSVASDGSQTNNSSHGPSLSADGRFVAFTSSASNVVSGDTNGVPDVFVHDQQTGLTERVSVASDGSESNATSANPTVSGDGRFVAFHSWASTLVPGDTNQVADVFVHDRQTGATERVSVASDGSEGNDRSLLPRISGDGRFVAFRSYASTLVPGDTNDSQDIFLHDRQTGETQQVSVAPDGSPGNNSSWRPRISADGRVVAFMSAANNLVPDDYYGNALYIHERETGFTERVPDAAELPALSADGRFVAFISGASDLVPGDTNDVTDVFIQDRQTGMTERVSVASDGTQANDVSARYFSPHISADGRFVAFDSLANNLVPGDTNGVEDVFIHDRQRGTTERVSVASDGAQANDRSTFPAISADGRFVTFQSYASNLVPGDTNLVVDVFVHDRGAAETGYSISGRVADQNNDPISDVTVVTNAGHTSTTNADGNYTITGVVTGTYTVTASKSGYTFFPAARTVTVPPDATGEDFVDQAVCLRTGDSDSDGLPDGWELCGYYHNRPPVGEPDVDLPAIGADLNIPDIFVEIDYMVDIEGSAIEHSHKPKPAAIQKVVDAFAQQGIHLHVDWGPLAELAWGDGLYWGSLSDGERLEHGDDDRLLRDGELDWSRFDAIKNGEQGQGHFQPARSEIFHYAIFAHSVGQGNIVGRSYQSSDCDDIRESGATDFVLGLKRWDEAWNATTVVRQAGVFMHELGHNLGLCEGGGDEVEYKPNYLSVMNYSFMWDGLIFNEQTGHIDFSNFGNDIVPPLVESSLDELAGLNSDAIEKYGTRYYCRSEDGWTNELDTQANTPIDWNCSGWPPWGVVEANINDGNEDEEDPTLSTLFAYNDWDNLVLDVFNNAEVPTNSPETSTASSDASMSIGEPDATESAFGGELYTPYAVAIGPGSGYVASPGLNATIPVTLANTGALTATVTLSHTVASWFDLSTIPVTVTLVPSATIIYNVNLDVPAGAVTGSEQEVTLEAFLNESPLMSDVMLLQARVGPMAWFEAEPVDGTVPHAVQFRDISVGQYTSRLWDFGDGAQSTGPNPNHVYTSPGVYTVSLTVTGADGTDVYTRENLIRVRSNRLYLPAIQK